MYTLRLCIFIILIFISQIKCQNKKNDKDQEDVQNERMFGYQVQKDYYEEGVFLWGSLLTVVSIQAVLMKYKIPIHYTIFSILAGLIAGLLALYRVASQKYATIRSMDFLHFLYFYMPGVMFKTAFSFDTYIFQKTFIQVLIISIPIAILTGVTLGFLVKVIMLPHWPALFSIVFGIFCTPINSSYTERYLRRLGVHMKQTSSLLDGEATFGVVNCYILYLVMTGYTTNSTSEWYQFVWAILRLILVGLLLGYLLGLVGHFLLKRMYMDHLGVVMLSFGLPFFTFGVTEIYFGGCGAISVLMLGVIMAKERSTLSPETDRLLGEFWKTVEKLLNMVMCLTSGFYIAAGCTILDWEHYVYTLVIYFVYYVLRFTFFLCFAPILSRTGYGMNIKTMMICVCGGLKSPFTFALTIIFMTKSHQLPFSMMDRMQMTFYSTWLYFLTFLINGTFIPALLKAMGVSQVSMAKQINMNNCMKHIFARRERMIWMLKMDRYLVDANWPIVNQATTMKHPDYVGTHADADVEDDYFLGYRYTYCADCKKEVAEEPTRKELKEMSREAKMRILKAKKMSYSRQYENGMVSKEGIRILGQAVELAMDTEEAVIKVDALHKKFDQESCFTRFVRKRVLELSYKKEEVIRSPRNYWRRLCYHTMKSKYFQVMMYVVTLYISITVLIGVIMQISHNRQDQGSDFFMISEVISTSIYTAEFVIKVMGYSHKSILKDGFSGYFKSFWNIMDFSVLIVFVIDITIELCEDHIQEFQNIETVYYIHSVFDVLQLIRLLKFVQLCKACYPKVIGHLDSKVDANMAFTYELGKAYASGEEEVVKLIPQIVDHEKIQDELKQRMEHDRVMITRLLGLVQKERPWIAITVKTKQAIRTIINSMKEAVLFLKTTGWTDNYEQTKLMKSINELYKNVNSIKTVQPSAPKVIFKEVAWMADDEAVFDFLFENVTVKKFDPGDIVFGEGKVADGIYIVVTGLFLLTYVPDVVALRSLKDYGILPIADYVAGLQYVDNVTEYIVSGNCIGELSTLTGRPYNCTITADAHSQVYVLSHGILKRAMELSPDFINGLECRIWKTVSIRIAVPVLMEVPTYQSHSLDQIKYALERAFMPNLSDFKIFTVTEMIQDILLIEGVARDFHTRDLFTAPCYIPRTVQKLILPTSSLIDIPLHLETKLLIIPESGVDEFDVMLLAEETCEMVATGSTTKCLQHTIQSRTSRVRRRRTRGIMDSRAAASRRRRYSSTRSMADVPNRFSVIGEMSESGSTYSRNMFSAIGLRLDGVGNELESHGTTREQNEE